MGLLEWAFGAGYAGLLISISQKERKRKHQESVRRNTPCVFCDGFSEYEFEHLVKQVGQRIRRISDISVCGPIVYGVVQSQSGISEWNFTLDFNDYGHVTGKYWISSDNDDSGIPERLGDMIQSAINDYLSEDDSAEYNEYPKLSTGGYIYCPYCGKQQTFTNALFCAFCGKRMR